MRGYAVGNFEDDDWIIQVRMLGYRLAVAGDAFIHHFGSVSMKALGEQDFNTVNKGNEQFYSQKGRSQALIAETSRLAQTPHSDPLTRSQANVSSLAPKVIYARGPRVPLLKTVLQHHRLDEAVISIPKVHSLLI